MDRKNLFLLGATLHSCLDVSSMSRLDERMRSSATFGLKEQKFRWMLGGGVVGAVVTLVLLGQVALYGGNWSLDMSRTWYGYKPWIIHRSDALSRNDTTEMRWREFSKVKRNAIVQVDQFSVRAARATMHATSVTAWVNPNTALSIFPPRSVALAITIDRRPVTWRRRLREYASKSSHGTVPFLGCSFSSYVMVGELGSIQLRSFKDLEHLNQCNLRFQFSNRRFASAFAENIKVEALKRDFEAVVDVDEDGSVVRVHGKARSIPSHNIAFQRAKKPQYPGFPWNVDCEFPSGVPSLTCENLTKASDEAISTNDDLQGISLESVFLLTKYGRIFNVSSSWPFSATQTHNDNVHQIARDLSMDGEDTDSAFIPSNGTELSLAIAEGPVYFMEQVDGKASLVSTHLNQSSGGVHVRLISNLIHQARQAPNSTRIIGVADGQVSATYKRVLEILNYPLKDLAPFCGVMLQEMFVKNPSAAELAPFVCRQQYSTTKMSGTLSDLLKRHGISILIVAFPLTTWAFESMPIAGQYAFDVWLFARYAADYQTMMYFDGDAVPIIKNQAKGTLQNILYEQLFTHAGRGMCNAARFHLIEQSIRPEHSSTSNELICVSNLLQQDNRWHSVLRHCDFSYGNLAARTDSVLGVNVHYTLMNPEDMPYGVSDCVAPGRGRFMTLIPPQDVIELHLSPKNRSQTCTCVF